MNLDGQIFADIQILESIHKPCQGDINLYLSCLEGNLANKQLLLAASACMHSKLANQWVFLLQPICISKLTNQCVFLLQPICISKLANQCVFLLQPISISKLAKQCIAMGISTSTSANVYFHSAKQYVFLLQKPHCCSALAAIYHP